jgi:flagellar motor protein MotB
MMTRAHPARPIWLMTLADLALLLVGFFVFIQAVARQDEAARAAVSASIRGAFGGDADIAAPDVAVDANIMPGFAPGSAALPRSPAALLDWTVTGARDGRTRVLVTGFADGSAADVDDRGSALALASARAAAIAAAIEARGDIAGDRIRIAASLAPEQQRGKPAARRVTVTISFGS